MKYGSTSSISSYHAEEVSNFIYQFKYGIWFLCVLFWVAGVCDRFLETLSDRFLSYGELSQLFIVISLFLSWLVLKPEIVSPQILDSHSNNTDEINLGKINQYRESIRQGLVKDKIYSLSQQECFLSKKYVLPGSYWVNMFHTLNPMHLNHVHKITQNGIKVTKVTQFLETDRGGVLIFSSVMEQAPGIIRNSQQIIKHLPLLSFLNRYIDMLRRPEFSSVLILHDAYTTELHIPTDKHYTSFIFRTSPLQEDKCTLSIDFYSSLPIPKIIKWLLFQIITPIVVWEDKNYLLNLSQKDPEFFRTIRRKVNDTHFLRLSQRFIELYG